MNRRMPNGTYAWCERTGKKIILTFLLDWLVSGIRYPVIELQGKYFKLPSPKPAYEKLLFFPCFQ